MSLSYRHDKEGGTHEPETRQRVISINNGISDEITIARMIAAKSDFSESVVLALIDELVAQIVNDLRMGQEVRLAGLGTFKSKNIAVKDTVATDAYDHTDEQRRMKGVGFRPSDLMIEELNIDKDIINMRQEAAVSKADRFQNILQAVDASGILMLKHVGIFNKCSLSTTYEDICELVELKLIKMLGNYAIIRA